MRIAFKIIYSCILFTECLNSYSSTAKLSFIDSNMNSKYQSLRIRKTNDPNLFSKKTNTEYIDIYKVKNKPFKSTAIAFSGNAVMETFAANTQNPLSLNELNYSRIWLSPKVMVFGLPFQTDLYYTTENNSIHNSNSFNIKFDAQTYKNQIMGEILQEVQNKRKSYETRKYDIEIKEKLLRELDERLNSIEAQKGKLKEEKLLQLKEQEQNMYDKRQNIKDTSLDINNNIIDYEEKYTSRFNYIQKKIDSLEKEKKTILEKTNQLIQKRNTLDSFASIDSIAAFANIAELNSKKNILEFVNINKTRYSKLLKIASSVDKFDIGISYPTHSTFSVMGIPIKGLSIDWSTNKYFFQVSGGKTLSNDFRFFTSEQSRFNRNCYAITSGIGSKDKNNLFINHTYFRDPINLRPNLNIKNSVISIGGQWVYFKERLKINGEFAQSEYSPINPTVYEFDISNTNDTFAFQDTRVYKNNKNSAVQANLRYNILKETEIFSKVQRVESGFKTLGNPFLRVGYLEKEIGVKSKLLTKRITATFFYKDNRDNLNKESQVTNEMRGYGIQMQTNFKNKYPNISFIHTPYQLGNNHPDSLLKSNNQFSLTNLSITHSRAIKKAFVTSVVSLTQSSMNFDRLNSVGMQNVLIHSSVALPNSLQFSVLWQSNITKPGIDTLNANLISLNISKNLNKKNGLSIETHATSFKNGAQKHGGKLVWNYRYNARFSISLASGFDYIEKLWGYEKKNVINGRLRINYNW